MTAEVPATAPGRLAMRAKGAPEWVPLADYTDEKRCSARTVRQRSDILTKKIDGHVFVHRSALALTIRGRAQR